MKRNVTLYKVTGMCKLTVEAEDLGEFLEKVEEIKDGAENYPMEEADREVIVTWMSKPGEADCKYDKVAEE